jgi:sec-independent protein translocase protein TatA
MIGTTELLLLGGLALLLFGGKKVPEMMRGLGQGVKEFKKGMKDCDNFIDKDEEVKKSNDESTPPLSTNTNAQDNEQKK